MLKGFTMDSKVIENLADSPQKIDDLLSLEEELTNAVDEDLSLQWNRSKKCVETNISQDNYDVEYSVIEHWAMHVGAKFLIDESNRRETEIKAYIYR